MNIFTLQKKYSYITNFDYHFHNFTFLDVSCCLSTFFFCLQFSGFPDKEERRKAKEETKDRNTEPESAEKESNHVTDR